MHQHVAELVRQRPGSRLPVQAGEDPDAAGGPHRDPVIGAAVLALDREALPPGHPAQGVPQAWRRVPWRGRDGRADCDGRAAGLGEIPDVADPVGVAPGRVRFIGFLVLVRHAVPGCGLAGGGEDRDSFFLPADLPSGLAPGAVVPHQGGAGLLRGDEQDVGEVLAGQPCGQPQAAGPVLGRAYRLGFLVQAVAQRGEFALAFFVTFLPLAG